jgi:uncharacterized protein YcgL (UPF0745 family)
MNQTRYLTEEELIDRALQALMDSLGPVETMRFLNLPRPRRLESVQRHRRWQAQLEKQHFFDQVFGKDEGVSNM